MVVSSNTKFLRQAFKTYYVNHLDKIKTLSISHRREYGYQLFDSNMMIRHLPIPDDADLHKKILNNTPSDIYCSNSHYMFPDKPMNDKIWNEAELIFDIDAKDLGLPCRESHTISICKECNHVSKYTKACNKCNSIKIKNTSLTCNKCIDACKIQVFKLITILTNDFGIHRDNIRVFFSGNDGFHIYVYDSQFQTSGLKERQELTDYIMFKGVIPETVGMKLNKTKSKDLFNLNKSGWQARFAKHVYGDNDPKKQARKMVKDGYKNMQKQLNYDIMHAIGVKIDPNVTNDIHRIFRLPHSINSKSSMVKIQCDIDTLDSFDPYNDAVLLSSNMVTIKATIPIIFNLRGKDYGNYRSDQQFTVPAYVATYLICKNLGDIISYK